MKEIKLKEKKYVSKVVRNKDQKFDFILYINNKPIVQRWFDVKNFNRDSLKSLELRELMGELIGVEGSTGLLTEKLKKESIEYLWGYYNPYYIQNDEEKKDIFENEDIFKLEILYNERKIVTGEFTGNYYPPRVRYQVNIKNEIFDVISLIREYLSKDSYTTI